MDRKLIIGLFILLLTTTTLLFKPSTLDKAEKQNQPQTAEEAKRPEPAETVEETLDLSNLKQILQREISAYKGEVALAVVDLSNGKAISIDGNKSFYPASTIKYLVLVSVLSDVETGQYTLASADKLISDMMSFSSNSAANKLMLKTGLEKLSRLPAKTGLANTVFIHGFSNGDENVPRLKSGSNSFTANDANLFWQKLYSGEILSSAMTKKALGYSKLPNVNLIYSPEKVSVYHKPGYIPYQYGETYIDSGIVETKKFSYAVSYLSRNNPTHQQGADFGRKLTKTIYDWFADNYE